MNYYTINETGIREIESFLLKTTHNPHGLSEDMLQAWASAAEFQLGEGNGASIKVSSFFSKSGRTETYTISDAGIDCHKSDYDDDDDSQHGCETTRKETEQ